MNFLFPDDSTLLWNNMNFLFPDDSTLLWNNMNFYFQMIALCCEIFAINNFPR